MSTLISPLLSRASSALWPLVPPHLLRAFCLAYLGNVFVLLSGLKRYQKPAQRMWLLSIYASGTMTMCSLPFFVDWVSSGGNVAAIKPRPLLAETACVAFMAHLFADLSLGLVFYRSHLTLGWKWTHHACFILVISWTLTHNLSHLFAFGGMMELPIYLIFLGFLEPALRNDTLSLVSLVALRLVLNVVLVGQFWTPSVMAQLPGEGWERCVPALLNTAILPGHVWIVQRMVRRVVREGREKRAARLAERAEKVVDGAAR
ncbi:hypothetical protein CALVIDRAFT_555456 [Calocera viscosa TUFC12733]|uniref:TLC domain-containing protein n=1 Tax=Calocera viscosa (strain TUFC12733) TaxID=1330018 RepID=A0A167LVL2_CALVF|nr:hypothetical protein CALVIDRAFT_555456 [Calocera viscosa TUFC12733]